MPQLATGQGAGIGWFLDMISVPEILIERICCAAATGEDLPALAKRTIEGIEGEFGGVIAATFSSPRRFPSLAVEIASCLGQPPETIAFDLQMACSAYPYAVYLAGKIAADTGKKVLVIDGDVQTPLVDSNDRSTAGIFSNACTATVVGVGEGTSVFSFLSRYDEALTCPAEGPIKMDGFKVFSFVATEVSAFLRRFGDDFDYFVPHQANPYMIRQLALSLGLTEKSVVLSGQMKNPGSCSIPMAIAENGICGRALIAGFGAGYSAAAGIVNIK